MTTSANLSGETGSKIYIIDTNVLLDDPEAIFSFKDNDVVIPLAVIEEIDRKKKEIDAVGRNARKTIRIIDKFRAQGATIANGVILPSGGIFRVEINNDRNVGDSPVGRLDLTVTDNRILLVAFNISEKEKVKNPTAPKKVILVSNDGALRIKAEAVGLRAEEYKTNIINFDTLYTGFNDNLQILSDEEMEKFIASKVIDHAIADALHNQYFKIRNESGQQNNFARYSDGKIHAVNNFELGHAFDLEARNPQQDCALDLLMNENIGMVTLIGTAGTGKTLLAIAAGLDLMSSGRYDRLVVTRPTEGVGKDLGYLPGDIASKMEPWMRPIFDSVDFLMMNNNSSRRGGFSYGNTQNESPSQRMINDGALEIQPLCYVRGITLPNLILVVDEAQNLSPHEVKTISTRVGENTRIFLTGDPNQIDNPYLTKDTNGLTYFVDHMKGEIDYGHITLIKGERSRIATICAQRL